MTARRLATACLALAAALTPATALAQGGLDALGVQQEEGPHATVDLLVAASSVKPGQTVAVGIRFKMQEGWHIYWQNPGDSGEPPTFAWNLPGGGAARMMRGGEWTATQPEFPTPVYFETSGLAGFGYEHEVVFPATVTVPASATPGQGADLTVVVDYLICSQERCIPESAVATVNLSVGMAAEEDAEATAAIKEALASVPRPAESSSTTIRVGEAKADQLVVSLPAGATDVRLFPTSVPTAMIEPSLPKTSGNGSNQHTIQISSRPLGNAGPVPSYEAVVGYTTADGHRRGALVTIPAAE